MAVAFVFSRYAGLAVANHSASGSAPFDALRSASRAASMPIVVVSSSYAATDRVPASAAAAEERRDLGPVEPSVRHVSTGADDASHGFGV